MCAELGFPSAGTVSYAEQTSVGHSSNTAGFCCIGIAKEGNRGLVLLGEHGLSSNVVSPTGQGLAFFTHFFICPV